MNSRKDLKEHLGQLLRHATDRGIASAYSLFVGFSDKDSPDDIIMHQGSLAMGPVGGGTVYDLASITKVIGTSFAIARAISRDRLSLLREPFLEWPGVTIRDILGHAAGIPAHRKFYDELSLTQHKFAENRTTIFTELLAIKARPKCERVYSDLGFMALGFILEQVYRKPLANIFLDTWTTLKIGAQFSWFPSRPLTYVSEDLQVAATGFCQFRKVELRAQVHDSNCFYMGGLAGHAGLFGTLSQVKRAGQWLLRAASNPKSDVDAIVARFAHEGLGFDKPNINGSTKDLSPQAFGHFGYTGTSLWVDPAMHRRGVVIVLLTNRVHCSEEPEGIFDLRNAIHRAVAQCER